jgi:hypothetical protein
MMNYSIEFKLKSSKEFYLIDYLGLVSIIFFFIDLILAVLKDYFFSINVFLFYAVGSVSLFFFLIWFIITLIHSKRRIIGKVIFKKDKIIIIESNKELNFDINAVKDLKITFKYFYGQLQNIWGILQSNSGIDDGDNKELYFIFGDKEYHYFFRSEHKDEKKWLSNLINYWKNNGVSCAFVSS